MNEPFCRTMPLQAWMHPTMHACVHVCVCLCMCECGHTVAQTPPGGKHGCSLLFLLLFQITVCFINAMVIWFPLLLRSPYLTKCRKAQRTPIDLSGSRDSVPLSQLLPCQSFMNAAGGKVAVGELQQTICSKQRAGNLAEPPVEGPGPFMANLFFIIRLFTLLLFTWMID